MKLTIAVVALVPTLLAVAAPSASADTPFATLDRIGKHGEVGVQFSLGVFDDVGDSIGGQDFFVDGFARFDLHGRFDVGPRLAVYTAVAITQMISDFEDEIGLSDIDVGLHYRIPTARGQNLIVRGGILLPTASDDIAPFVSNFWGNYTRIVDTPMIFPNTTWARLSLNYMLRSGALFAQGDFGVDIAIAADGNNPDPWLHLNGALGVELSNSTLTFELANSVPTEGDDNWDTTFATMLRFGRSHVEPYVGLILPVDDPLDAFIFAAGIAGPI